jgi:hypothetical protein
MSDLTRQPPQEDDAGRQYQRIVVRLSLELEPTDLPVANPGGPVTQEIQIIRASLRTPRAAALAGIAFSLLVGTA